MGETENPPADGGRIYRIERYPVKPEGSPKESSFKSRLDKKLIQAAQQKRLEQLLKLLSETGRH